MEKGLHFQQWTPERIVFTLVKTIEDLQTNKEVQNMIKKTHEEKKITNLDKIKLHKWRKCKVYNIKYACVVKVQQVQTTQCGKYTNWILVYNKFIHFKFIKY